MKKSVRLAALAVASVAALSGCANVNDSQLGRVGMPVPATAEGPRILLLWQGSWLAAMIVAVLVWGLLFWALIVYRRKAGDTSYPPQTRYNVPIEIGYTIAPLIMILALFYFTARDQAVLTKVSGDQKHTVNVVGWRWSWAFNYLDEGVYDVGTPGSRPTLWLPVDEKVKFTLSSPDVIHSFWVPAFLTKMDVVPGQANALEVTPNKVGTYAGKCAELCGVEHSGMLFDVKVVSRTEYEAHIAQLRTLGQVGKLDNGRSVVAGAS